MSVGTCRVDVFAASIVGPSWLADGVSAVALMTLHLVAALVILGGFAATMPWRRRSTHPKGPEDTSASSAIRS